MEKIEKDIFQNIKGIIKNKEILLQASKLIEKNQRGVLVKLNGMIRRNFFG